MSNREIRSLFLKEIHLCGKLSLPVWLLPKVWNTVHTIIYKFNIHWLLAKTHIVMIKYQITGVLYRLPSHWGPLQQTNMCAWDEAYIQRQVTWNEASIQSQVAWPNSGTKNAWLQESDIRFQLVLRVAENTLWCYHNSRILRLYPIYNLLKKYICNGSSYPVIMVMILNMLKFAIEGLGTNLKYTALVCFSPCRFICAYTYYKFLYSSTFWLNTMKYDPRSYSLQ